MTLSPISLAYPDYLLFEPFEDIPRAREEARRARLAGALAEEMEAVKARADARTARYAARKDREIAVAEASARLLAARIATKRAATGGGGWGVRISRSEAVRALVLGAALAPPLPEKGIGGAEQEGRARTTVAFHAVTHLLRAKVLPAGTLEQLLDRALASPAVVEMARSLLLLPADELERMAYETLYALDGAA